MNGYLQRLMASRPSAPAAARTASVQPVGRSSSPLAESDQRLHDAGTVAGAPTGPANPLGLPQAVPAAPGQRPSSSSAAAPVRVPDSVRHDPQASDPLVELSSPISLPATAHNPNQDVPVAPTEPSAAPSAPADTDGVRSANGRGGKAQAQTAKPAATSYPDLGPVRAIRDGDLMRPTPAEDGSGDLTDALASPASAEPIRNQPDGTAVQAPQTNTPQTNTPTAEPIAAPAITQVPSAPQPAPSNGSTLPPTPVPPAPVPATAGPAPAAAVQANETASVETAPVVAEPVTPRRETAPAPTAPQQPKNRTSPTTPDRSASKAETTSPASQPTAPTLSTANRASGPATAASVSRIGQLPTRSRVATIGRLRRR